MARARKNMEYLATTHIYGFIWALVLFMSLMIPTLASSLECERADGTAAASSNFLIYLAICYFSRYPLSADSTCWCIGWSTLYTDNMSNITYNLLSRYT